MIVNSTSGDTHTHTQHPLSLLHLTPLFFFLPSPQSLSPSSYIFFSPHSSFPSGLLIQESHPVTFSVSGAVWRSLNKQEVAQEVCCLQCVIDHTLTHSLFPVKVHQCISSSAACCQKMHPSHFSVTLCFYPF